MQFNLDYFYGNGAGPFRFYRMPKALFESGLSLEATMLYSLMLDRVRLSAKNGWMDGLGRVFIYFVQKDAQTLLHCGHNQATAFMRELERFGLIERKRQGLGKPAMIYVRTEPSVRPVCGLRKQAERRRPASISARFHRRRGNLVPAVRL